MDSQTPLIATVIASLVLAFIFGTLAHRLRIPPLVGYLIAGIIIGPFTPGFVADMNVAHELAEIGVILLMFGVGLHFSFNDLLSVKWIAIPGALLQIVFATLLGMGLAWTMNWPLGEGFIFGLALSCASTVVLLTALQERGLINTRRGQIAIGWLVVEDIVMVLALVLIPALAALLRGQNTAVNIGDIFATLGVTLGKVVVFMMVMVVFGKRAIPWVLQHIEKTGSRELFGLSVLAIALGVAVGSAYLFGVSLALGAFFAGMMLAESDLSHRAAEESLPLRDMFCVLFFVSVGMLLDPSILIDEPLLVLATVLIIVLGKSIAAFVLVLAMRHPASTALTISASLAQIGEFSFILATLGVSLQILSPTASNLILAGAIFSIFLNPFFFKLLAYLRPWLERQEQPSHAARLDMQRNHIILVGYGALGQMVGEELSTMHLPFIIVEHRLNLIQSAHNANMQVISGYANTPGVLNEAQINSARCVILTLSDSLLLNKVISHARMLNSDIPIIAVANSIDEVKQLKARGANHVLFSKHAVAKGLAGLVT